MTTRRPHTKSHHGCSGCKRRKIKCDEGRPSCTTCDTKARICVYGASASINSAGFGRWAADPKPAAESAGVVSGDQSSPPTNEGSATLPYRDMPTPATTVGASPDAIPLAHEQYHSRPANSSPQNTTDMTFTPNALKDMQILHHWTLHTYAAATGIPEVDARLRDLVVRESFSHPYMLHMILALAACHLSHVSAPSNTKRCPWRIYGQRHYAHGISLYRSALTGSYEAKDCSALVVTSALAAITAVAVAEKTAQVARQELLQICEMLHGMHVMKDSMMEQVMDGPFFDMMGPPAEVLRPNCGSSKEVGHLRASLMGAVEGLDGGVKGDYVRLVDYLCGFFEDGKRGAMHAIHWLTHFSGACMRVLVGSRTELNDAFVLVIGAALTDLDDDWEGRGFGRAIMDSVVPDMGPQWIGLVEIVESIVSEPREVLVPVVKQ